MKKQKNERGHLIPFTQNAEYFFQRALKYYYTGNLYKAKKFLLRAVKLDEFEPTYTCQLASVLAELGEFSESNEWLYYTLEELEPTLAECHFFLASNYVHLGMLDKAEEEALFYLEIDPQGEFATEAQELLFLIGAELPEEMEENELLRRHSEAKRKMETGHFEEAIALFLEMIEEHPTFWAAYNNLALAYFYTHERDEAMATLELVLTKNPGNLHALCNVTLFYSFLGMDQECQALIQRLKKVYPIHEDHRYKLGSTFALLQEHEYAYRWLSSLNTIKYLDDLPFHHWLAVSAFLTDRPEAAKVAWEHVERLDLKGEVAPYYLKKLKEGTLRKEEVVYQYRLPKGTKSYFELLTDGLDEDERSELLHLYILRKKFSKQGYETLKDFCHSPTQALHLKELAAFIMLRQTPNLPVMIKHEGLEMIYTDETQFPLAIATGMNVIEELHASLHASLLNHTIYRVWSPLFKYAFHHEMSFANKKGWAAAIEYVVRKNIDPLTQKEISDQYEVAVSTVSYYVRKVREIVCAHT